ncbi:flagellar motor switch protein FliM [Shouchella lehensis]|uniref:Flagellar motor switch protein FliM n=1 Tax=Shouchella lehensis TaxID=300825 RepID=A0A4Y7WQ78_9BACI|nr:flagellar motor switch protein FliM [Shouchella lehensis]MBG9784321.1 flagellar motor switch protein FliM [Shouchella lehensis]RQW20668.1 flagellar motor switch protein FliM [Bacillus sp. C1-1]TES50688.1 flagellar motor switch protein FliM [Shouchella lehensis]
MADVLSQGEIDELLSALTTGEKSAEDLLKVEAEKKVRTYDFKRALRFSKDQMRNLSRIHENYARILTTYFSARLRSLVQIQVASVEQVPYEEYVRSIPSMTFLNVVEPRPLSGRFLLETNPNIAYAMFDRVLGGRGTSINKIDNLTDIEKNILSGLFDSMVRSFAEAWSSVVQLEPVSEVTEVNPHFLQMVSPNETVVVISLATSIAETSGLMTICLPHVVLEDVLPKLTNHHWFQEQRRSISPEEEEMMNRQLKKTTIDVSVDLGKSAITIEEFLKLSIDDVITLDQELSSPLHMNVGGALKFKGQPGLQRDRMAIQVTDIVGGTEDE